MPLRIRHCIECPACRTRYVIGFSPYGNGTYLLARCEGSCERYTLLCSCGEPFRMTRLSGSGVIRYLVPPVAYKRGYGSPEEVVALARP